MGAHTERDIDGSGRDRYWRRRAVTLASVLGAVGLLAWACTGAAGDDTPARTAGAITSPPAAPTAMPTVTVTTTTIPEETAAPSGGPCRGGDLVVSMSPSRTTYAGAARPEFRVTVVNMGGGPCALGARTLDLRITSGADRIWSSADCRRGDAPRETIRRGVPYVDTVMWNRRRGCKAGAPARPGTYVAVLKGNAKKQIFQLR